MTIGIGADIILLSLIAISLGIYHYARNTEDLKEFEDSFIREHINHKPYRLLTLEFDEAGKEYFLKICSHVVKWNILDKYPPQLENHFLDFKEAVSHRFFVQMIRCTKNLAIIDAKGQYHCFYVLKKGHYDKRIDDTIFHIHDQFCYYDETGDQPHLPETVDSDFQKEARHIIRADRESPYHDRDHTNVQHSDHELGEPIMAFPERNPVHEIDRELRYQPEHLRLVQVPEIETNEYSHPQDHFIRSKSVRRWSSAENDIYHGNRLPRQPSSEEEQEVNTGYRTDVQGRPYPPVDMGHSKTSLGTRG